MILRLMPDDAVLPKRNPVILAVYLVPSAVGEILGRY
jgi:hypothetical protein